MKLAPESRQILPLGGAEVESEAGALILARRKSIGGGHWIVIADGGAGIPLHRRLRQCGADVGLLPAGSLTYNSLRIRSGRPGRLELSPDYIPLEVGLWDEISFSKGCYTGQEIIARMESRGRLAKILVRLELAAMAAAPAPVFARAKAVGTLTSSVAAADGRIYGLAVLKIGSAQPGADLIVGDGGARATVVDYAGAPPPFALRESAAPGSR